MGRLNNGAKIGSLPIMSLYEILAVLALVAAGGYAYSLYRGDLRRRPPESEESTAAPAPDQLMFGRRPRERGGDDKGDKPPR